MTPKLVVLQPWKKLHVLQKNFFRKQNPSSLFVKIRLQKSEREFFKNKWVSRYLTLADFLVPKNCSSP